MKPDVLENAVKRTAGVMHHTDLYERVSDYPRLFRPLRAPIRWRVLPREFRQTGVVFIHVPKNAGTSISSALYGRQIGHVSVRCYSFLEPYLFQTMPSFAVLRDPIDRTLSAYWMLRRGGGSAIPTLPGLSDWLPDITDFQVYLDFLEASLTNMYMTDFVMRPQHWFISDQTGTVIVRDLFVLGYHNDALARYLAHFGVKSLGHENTTDRGSVNLSSAQEAQIRRIYARDFQLIEQVLGADQVPVLARS